MLITTIKHYLVIHICIQNIYIHMYVIAVCLCIVPVVTIMSSPAGTPVNGLNNTYEYAILSSVDLMCMAGPPPDQDVNVSYSWDTTGCYSHTNYNPDSPRCFPHNSATQEVISIDLTAEDAGTITCTVTIYGDDYTSKPFTLRISGELEYDMIVVCI